MSYVTNELVSTLQDVKTFQYLLVFQILHVYCTNECQKVSGYSNKIHVLLITPKRFIDIVTPRIQVHILAYSSTCIGLIYMKLIFLFYLYRNLPVDGSMRRLLNKLSKDINIFKNGQVSYIIEHVRNYKTVAGIFRNSKCAGKFPTHKLLRPASFLGQL